MSSWYKETDEGVELLVRVVPNASKNEVVGEHNGRLKVKICKPPEDGKANKELARFLATAFGVSKSSVEIQAGGKIREKKLFIHGVNRVGLQDAMPFFLDF